MTTLIGIAGALIGGFLAGAIFDADPLDEFWDLSTWLTAIVGAIVLLLIYGWIDNRSRGAGSSESPGRAAAAGVRASRRMSRLHLHAWGPDDGRPVLVIHGVTNTGARYRRLAEEELPGLRVLAPDLRGHGHSTWEPPWSVERHVEDLVLTLDGAGVGGAVWSGTRSAG